MLAPLETGGNLVSDAHLAALAVEHRCTPPHDPNVRLGALKDGPTDYYIRFGLETP